MTFEEEEDEAGDFHGFEEAERADTAGSAVFVTADEEDLDLASIRYDFQQGAVEEVFHSEFDVLEQEPVAPEHLPPIAESESRHLTDTEEDEEEDIMSTSGANPVAGGSGTAGGSSTASGSGATGGSGTASTSGGSGTTARTTAPPAATTTATPASTVATTGTTAGTSRAPVSHAASLPAPLLATGVPPTPGAMSTGSVFSAAATSMRMRSNLHVPGAPLTQTQLQAQAALAAHRHPCRLHHPWAPE